MIHLILLALLALPPTADSLQPPAPEEPSILQCSLSCSRNKEDVLPVCGQDGVMYKSLCAMGCHGVSPASAGVCLSRAAAAANSKGEDKAVEGAGEGDALKEEDGDDRDEGEDGPGLESDGGDDEKESVILDPSVPDTADEEAGEGGSVKTVDENGDDEEEREDGPISRSERDGTNSNEDDATDDEAGEASDSKSDGGDDAGEEKNAKYEADDEAEEGEDSKRDDTGEPLRSAINETADDETGEEADFESDEEDGEEERDNADSTAEDEDDVEILERANLKSDEADEAKAGESADLKSDEGDDEEVGDSGADSIADEVDEAKEEGDDAAVAKTVVSDKFKEAISAEIEEEYGGGSYLGVLLGGVDEFKKAIQERKWDGWDNFFPSVTPGKRDLLQATIFGDNGLDDRTQVLDLQVQPFNLVGLVNPPHCTGSIVGPRHILTSAHCLFDLDKNSWFSNLSFMPGVNMTWGNPVLSIPFQFVMAKKCYVDESRRECDFGMGILPYNIPGIDQWFEIGMNCDGTELALHTAGFPLDKAPASLWTENCGKTFVRCNPESQILRHTCDVVPGMSGAPLWDDDLQIRAIHRGEERIFGSSNNIAVYINKKVHKSIQDWIGGPYQFLWEVRENENQLHIGNDQMPVLYSTDSNG